MADGDEGELQRRELACAGGEAELGGQDEGELQRRARERAG